MRGIKGLWQSKGRSFRRFDFFVIFLKSSHALIRRDLTNEDERVFKNWQQI